MQNFPASSQAGKTVDDHDNSVSTPFADLSQSANPSVYLPTLILVALTPTKVVATASVERRNYCWELSLPVMWGEIPTLLTQSQRDF